MPVWLGVPGMLLLDLQSNVKTKPPRAPLSSRVEREKPGTQHRLFVGSGPAGCAPFREPGRLLTGQGCLKCLGPRPVHSPPPPQGQFPANLRPLCEPSHVGRGRLPKTVFEHLLFPREASLKVTFEGRLGGWRRKRGASRGGLKALVAETLEDEIAGESPGAMLSSTQRSEVASTTPCSSLC